MCLLVIVAACGREVAKPSISYVAIGDSLAAGQTPYAEIGDGYADMIAEKLDGKGQLDRFTKDLAVPGFTADDVLQQLESEEAHAMMEPANLITISAGANDLLRLVQVEPADGTVWFNEEQVQGELDSVQKNMVAILAELEKQAPDADVYVMGYYFPFPHLQENQKRELEEQLDRLNEMLKNTAEQEGAFFVPIEEAFGEDATDKLPSATDIHPNSEGYKAMADAFFDSYPVQ
jgi:lysophospholipase L1-like esterase